MYYSGYVNELGPNIADITKEFLSCIVNDKPAFINGENLINELLLFIHRKYGDTGRYINQNVNFGVGMNNKPFIASWRSFQGQRPGVIASHDQSGYLEAVFEPKCFTMEANGMDPPTLTN